MNKVKTNVLLCLVFLLISCSKKGNTMFEDQAILSIEISAYSCRFDLQVNGVSIASNPKSLPLEVTIPINHWLKDGNNKLTLIQDISDKKTLEISTCKATLLIKKNGFSNDTKKIITNLGIKKGQNKSVHATILDANTLKDADDGLVVSTKVNVEIKQDKLQLSRKINLPVNFPKWKWLTSDKIIDTRENRASLYKEYKKIHESLKNKNFTILSQLMSERLKEIAFAFYKTPQEIAEFSEIQKDALDSKQELLDLEPESDNEFRITGNGRLVEITRWDGKAQIVYGYKDESMYGYYHLIFRKEGGRWILTR